MTASRAFHATYREGMKFSFGNNPELLEELEIYGGGLETTSPLNIGGPLVAHLRSSQGTVIGWIKGLPSSRVGRSGAWEAWGIVIPPRANISIWPTYWELLTEFPPDESRLTKMAGMIETGRLGPSLPSPPQNLVPWLTKLHYEAVRDPKCQQFLLSIRSPEEIPLLPWVWLLGPIPSTQATLGPPRRIPTAISPPLTYEGKVSGEQATFRPEESAYIRALVDEALLNGLVFALNSINQLREQRLEVRMKWLGFSLTNTTFDIAAGPPLPIQVHSAPEMVAVPPSPAKAQARIAKSESNRRLSRFKDWLRFKPEPSTQSESRPEDKEAHRARHAATPDPSPTSELTVLKRRLDFIITALILIATLQLWPYFTQSTANNYTKPTTSTTRLDLTKEQSKKNVQSANRINNVEQIHNTPAHQAEGTTTPRYLAESLLRRLSLKTSAKTWRLLNRLAKDQNATESPQQPLTADEKRQLAHAAIQIFLIENKCMSADVKIDGEIGIATEQGFAHCPQFKNYFPNDPDRALNWLYKWLQIPSLDDSKPQP